MIVLKEAFHFSQSPGHAELFIRKSQTEEGINNILRSR